MRKLLVTSALPYANGELHLGSMLEHIQTDIWVRFQKMRGHQCISVCGDDAHGAPIMLKAQSLNIKPEELIATMQEKHETCLNGFYVHYDSYHTTHSEENKSLAQTVYLKLKENGDIFDSIIEQAYDKQQEMFLPDRFIKGDCPRCGAPEQYGDNCEVCGATYSPTEVKNPKSVLSGTTPIQKNSKHLFFDLPKYKDFLQAFVKSESLQSEVRNKLNEWFEQGLRAWDISRDAPYFGFEIPGEDKKFFYVWLDAPIGYMASFKKYCDNNTNIQFDDYWQKKSETELYHFIGKDILYFHTLFWPAMLEGAGYRKPTAVYAHGFLTINGKKMSKSRGTLINACTYLNHLNPEYLRYYYACKLGPQIEDIDLSFDDFSARINSDLIGKIINIASRSAGFIRKKYDNQLTEKLDNHELIQEFMSKSDAIATFYEQREYAKMVRTVTELADKANQYIATKAPWKTIKDEDKFIETHQVVSTAINLFRLIIIYLKPVLPMLAQSVEEFLNIEPVVWEDSQKLLGKHTIKVFKPLMQRIEQTSIDALLEDSKQ